ncbi:MAG: hypothetical protein JWM64_189 [Frankiales bacterium]|nr:hypothetical protein [Frankiales bacterium]
MSYYRPPRGQALARETGRLLLLSFGFVLVLGLLVYLTA